MSKRQPMTQVTIEGAASLDEAIAALERELAATLERAMQLQQALAVVTEKRLTQYELELAATEGESTHGR